MLVLILVEIILIYFNVYFYLSYFAMYYNSSKYNILMLFASVILDIYFFRIKLSLFAFIVLCTNWLLISVRGKKEKLYLEIIIFVATLMFVNLFL